MKEKYGIVFFSLALCLSSTLFAQTTQTTLDYDDRVHPELAQNFMVVSQNHHSTDAGYQILKQGGNAIDAAVAVGFALGFVFFAAEVFWVIWLRIVHSHLPLFCDLFASAKWYFLFKFE